MLLLLKKADPKIQNLKQNTSFWENLGAKSKFWASIIFFVGNLQSFASPNFFTHDTVFTVCLYVCGCGSSCGRNWALKMRDMIMTDQYAGHEIAGHDIEMMMRVFGVYNWTPKPNNHAVALERHLTLLFLVAFSNHTSILYYTVKSTTYFAAVTCVLPLFWIKLHAAL